MTLSVFINWVLFLILGLMAKKHIELWQQREEAMVAAEAINKDYQDCVKLLKDESERASLYYRKYMSAIGRGNVEYGEVNTGIGSGKPSS